MAGQPKPESSECQPKWKLVWFNIIVITSLHLASLYGAYLIVFAAVKMQTILFAALLYVGGILGISAGAHRLWSHQAYKATTPFRILLAVLNTIAFQESIYKWVRNHRLHHKFSDTNADPHNGQRGLFFSHIGWLLVRKNIEVVSKGKTIDMSDLKQDPVVVFQHKYYHILMPLACFAFPTFLPVYCWGETFSNAWFVSAILRYTITLNVTAMVNSFAHFYGEKPYDRYMNPAENLMVSIFTLGEGWHNYHHTFPWDYRTAELGNFKANFTTIFIDTFSKIGWAYELKSVSAELIAKRALRTGDGSHQPAASVIANRLPILLPHKMNNTPVWGWNDSDLNDHDRAKATIFNARTVA